MQVFILRSWCLVSPGQVLVRLLSCSLFVGGFALQNSKILLCLFLEEESGTCPKPALLFLDGSSLVSASPPFPDQQLSEPALWNLGKTLKAEAYSLKTRNEGHSKACAQEPLCSVSEGVIP